MELFASIATWALTAALGAVAGWFASALKKSHDQNRAIADGIRCILRSKLVDAYDAYVHSGKRLTVERKAEIVEAYEAYHALGGNGAIAQLYDDLSEIDVYIVR